MLDVLIVSNRFDSPMNIFPKKVARYRYLLEQIFAIVTKLRNPDILAIIL